MDMYNKTSLFFRNEILFYCSKNVRMRKYYEIDNSFEN